MRKGGRVPVSPAASVPPEPAGMAGVSSACGLLPGEHLPPSLPIPALPALD